MNIVIWIVTIALAGMFIFAGAMKATTPREKLKDRGMAYVEDFSDNTVRAIGVVEVLAGIGLILPAITGIGTIFVPLAATGLVLTMIGAIITHVRRGENSAIGMNVVIGLLALFVAVMRFGPQAL